MATARDTHATAAVGLLAGMMLFALPAALTWDVEWRIVPLLLLSAALEVAYFALLAATYARADYSFAYPVARGTAPVLVLGFSVLVLHAHVALRAALGVLAVAGGVLLVRGVGRAAVTRAATALALAVGACIAGYTLVDDHALHHAAALSYFEAVLALSALPYAAAVAALQGPRALGAALSRRSVAAGAGMVGAYVLALAALDLTEAAPVAALRETSVVMAAFGAAVVGHEHVPSRRLLGAALVVAGIAAIALA